MQLEKIHLFVGSKTRLQGLYPSAEEIWNRYWAIKWTIGYYAFENIQTISQFILHAIVSWPATALRHDPIDILAWILDVASLTVNAVLRIDLQSFAIPTFQRHEFINAWEQIKHAFWIDKTNNMSPNLSLHWTTM